MSYKKQLILVIALAVAAGGLWAYRSLFMERVYADEFVGQVVESNGNTLTAEGVFKAKDRPDLTEPSANTRRVILTIGPNTKLIKTLMYLPTDKELEVMGGRYYGKDLRQENVEGSREDLTKNMGITVKSKKNFYAKSEFTPDEIIYIEPVYPEE